MQTNLQHQIRVRYCSLFSHRAMLPVTSLGIKGFSHVYSLIRRITSLLEKGYNGLVVVVAPPNG
ncbi:hypothetical protein RQP52_06980, partial [Paenibacillus sp. PFR10]